MSSPQYPECVTTRVPEDVKEFIDSEAERMGENRAECVRQILSFYREGREAGLTCPTCEHGLMVKA